MIERGRRERERESRQTFDRQPLETEREGERDNE